MEVSGPSRIPIYEPPHDLREHQSRAKTIIVFQALDAWRERRLLWNVAWKTAVLSSIIALDTARALSGHS